MQKTALALLFAGIAASAFAADFAQEHTLTINGAPAYLAETSARVLGNAQGTAPELVDDITDGLGARKIAGYKVMIMGRTYSVAAETKPPKEGQTQWRGVKLFVGIPVVNGKMDLAHAQLLNIGVVDDNGGASEHLPDEKIRPVGKQLMNPSAKVEQPRLKISALDWPDMAHKATNGGGVKLEAEAVIDGKRIHTKMDSPFARFYTAKPTSSAPFKADARFVK